VILSSSQAISSPEFRPTKERKKRSEHGRPRPRPAARRGVSLKPGEHKHPRKGAMEEPEKVTNNGHLRRSPDRTSRCKLHRARTGQHENPLLHGYFPPNPSLSLVSAFAGEKLDHGIRGVTAARQVAREDTSAARVKDPSEKNDRSTSGKKPSIPTMFPPLNPSLNVHLGSGPGRTRGGGNPSPIAGGLQLGT
jgi:hypothetical protein